MNPRTISIGLFILLLSQMGIAATIDACELNLDGRDQFAFREMARTPAPRIQIERVQHTGVVGVTVDGRAVLDVARGGGRDRDLISVRWSGTLGTRQAHDFLAKIFPVPGRPRLVVAYQNDLLSEVAYEGVPKLGRLYLHVLVHNISSWCKALSRQEGELRVSVDEDVGLLSALTIIGDVNHVGRWDLDADEPDANSETPAVVMAQFNRQLLGDPEFSRALSGLVGDTADETALFNVTENVLDAVRRVLP